jgi:hypothetical protein
MKNVDNFRPRSLSQKSQSHNISTQTIMHINDKKKHNYIR